MSNTPKRSEIEKKKERARELVRQILVEDFRQHPSKKMINDVANKLVKSLTKQVA